MTRTPRIRTRAAVTRLDPRFVLLVGLMTSLPAISTDMYLPSLPDVAADLNTTEAAAQLTITGVLVGGAIGQLIIGPLSDRYGRRRPFLIGVTIHVITSIFCAIAPGIVPLIAIRAVQGLGNAAAGVIAMAVIRDRFAGADAARMMSRLMLVIGAAPMLAPTAGGIIAGWWGWRAVFYVLAAGGLALMVIVWRFLPETLPVARRRTEGLAGSLQGYGVLLRDRHFLVLALLPGLGMAVLMSYVVGAPFVLREGFGLSEHQFAAVFAINGLGMVFAAQLNAAIVQRVAPVRILRVTLPAVVLLCLAVVAVAILDVGGLFALLIPLWLVLACNGFISSNAGALALSRHGERAGAAAAVIGFAQAGVAGLVASLVGVVATWTSAGVAMALVMLGAGVFGLVVLATATPAYRRGGWLG